MQIKSQRMKSNRSSRKDDSSDCAIAKGKLKKLKQFNALEKDSGTESLILKKLDVSRATIYRWQAQYKQHGLVGLENQSRRPKRIHRPEWSEQLEQEVLRLKRSFPKWGKKRLHRILVSDHGFQTSESTVGRILKRLVTEGKCKPSRYYTQPKKPKRTETYKRRAKKKK